MSKRLEQYKGRLTASQITKGINAAIRNAKRFADDANLLVGAGRYPTATAIAILSIEEAGKATILRELALAKDEKVVSDCWRAYRSHAKKNVMWLLPQLVARGARKLDDFRPLFDETSDHPHILDQVKQVSLYTDCLGNAHWSIPEEVIDEELARMIVFIANVFAHCEKIEPKEIELWIKHLGSVWMRSHELMEKGLENWYAEMQEVGLAPSGRNEMEEFIRRGIKLSKSRSG
jgi:AbiV family abortive infection protein